MRETRNVEDLISDHAVLRFVERSWGVDVEGARRVLSQKKILDPGVTLGTCVVPIDSMTKAVFRNGIMITVLPLDARAKLS
jgi:hypothetical protein